MNESRYDLVVLGRDLAAVSAAREAAALGARVAWVKVGAESLDRPTQEILWASEHALRLAARRAVQCRRNQSTSRPDFEPDSEALQWVAQAQAKLLPSVSGEDLEDSGVDVYADRSVFAGPDKLTIDGRVLAFRKAILATGGRPTPVALEGAEPDCCWTAERLAGLDHLPQRLAIVGAGARQCPWAQSFARLGCDVSLLGSTPTILDGEDSAAIALIQRQMEKEGVRLLLGYEKLSMDRTGNQCAVMIEKGGQREKRFFDQVLIDPPLVPSTEGLGLEAAGISADERGIAIDPYLSTTNPRVLAAGGVCGEQFSRFEVADAMGRQAARNALRLFRRKFNPLVVPRYVFSEPAIARVGLTAAEAASQPAVKTYRAELAGTGEAALTEGEPGFVAVHTDRWSGRVLGAYVVAKDAGELLTPLVLLMAQRIPLSRLADWLPCRPSRMEILARLADLDRQSPRPRWSSRCFTLETRR
jgi:pyruvate/2-oxoglutarate dehydrogenase complex dihydrolipoamide dehydrogenase (E3) component